MGKEKKKAQTEGFFNQKFSYILKKKKASFLLSLVQLTWEGRENNKTLTP